MSLLDGSERTDLSHVKGEKFILLVNPEEVEYMFESYKSPWKHRDNPTNQTSSKCLL